MKKFNEEMYKQIKKEGIFEDQYYKYIVIDKKIILKGWKTSWMTSLKYEFFGILDTNKKDIFTVDNMKELQDETNEEARKEVIKDIIKNYDYYKNIQKKLFDEKIKNEDFKRSILYYYTDCYSSNNFKELFIQDVKPEELKKQLIDNIINSAKSENEETFINKFLTKEKSEIINEIKEKIKNNVNKWDFDYNWQNGIPEAERIDQNFDNLTSLRINKAELVENEYKKLFNNPSKTLIKAKKMYYLLKEYNEKNKNKTCNIYLKNDLKLKCLDFDYLINRCLQGNEKAISYRLFTGSERCLLETYNEEQGRGKRENDLFLEDIKKIEFKKDVIFDESGDL